MTRPSYKRRLSSSSSSFLSGGDLHVPGFTRIPLPNPSTPPLRRTVSDIIYADAGAPDPPSSSPLFFNPQSPCKIAKKTVLETSPSSAAASTGQLLPPLPNLYRTISDPTFSAYPPLPSTARTLSQSPGSIEKGLDSMKGESPSSKRLKRMKDRMIEMGKWCEEIIREGEEDSPREDDKNKTEKDEDQKNESGEVTEEAVWVEKKGECMMIHFNCSCGQGYEILFSGNNCYYKLI